MINYLISYPTRQIRINLKLYLERYEFSNFYRFFLFFKEFFKNNRNLIKLPVDVATDAM